MGYVHKVSKITMFKLSAISILDIVGFRVVEFVHILIGTSSCCVIGFERSLERLSVSLYGRELLIQLSIMRNILQNVNFVICLPIPLQDH